MSYAGGAQAIDLSQPSPFEGFDVSLLEHEGLISEGGGINWAYLIAQSAMMGNAATVGMFFNPHYYDSEVGMDATGIGPGLYSGGGGRGAVGGSTIWW
jgi:hypothetical protein